MAKSVVSAEQLGRSLVQQHHGNGGHNTFRQHVGAVVSQAVDPRGQTIAQVAPDQLHRKRSTHTAAEPTATPTSLFLNGLANTQASPRKEKAST